MAIVYRYIDIDDGIIKYVGIVHRGTLDSRIRSHTIRDRWHRFRRWRVEYFKCANRSEAEAFESHLIALYGTDKYYNKAKSGWGLNKYLPNVEDCWKLYGEETTMDVATTILVDVAMDMVKTKHYQEAVELLGCFEHEVV